MEPLEQRTVSIKVLREKTKNFICDLLNPPMYISAPNGILRYWRGLAGLCKIGSNYEASIADDKNATGKVLQLWCEQDPEHSTVNQLLLFLEEMDRFDVIDDAINLIDDDIQQYRTNGDAYNPQIVSLEVDKYIITDEDVDRINRGLELENYDAFLLYDQDDIDFATELLSIMENTYNMKFCVKDRDLVGGGLETDKVITLITERCNRLVVILSDSFFKSSVNDYFLKFAQAYGIDRQRKIIPCVYKDLTHQPPHVKFLFTLDYRRMAMSNFNFWDKLRSSLVVINPEKITSIESRSTCDNTTKSSLVDSKNTFRLKPLQQAVKFSSSVGDLKNLETYEGQTINSSTSADNLGPNPGEIKREKKQSLFKIKFPSLRKKEKSNGCTKAEREKSTGFFKKHMKRAAAVAN